MTGLVLTILVVILVYKFFVFIFSLLYARNDIADVSWGISFLIIAVTTLIYTDNYFEKYFLIAILTFIWAIRISARIFIRNWNKKEDFRYQRLRDTTNNYFWLRSFLQIYILQGGLSIVVSLPIIVAGLYGRALDGFSILGLSIWMIGFFFEAVGDFQLDKFKNDKNNSGKILRTGLWKYSRHPNYFGEITMWWGVFIMCLNLPLWWVAILGPITITILITKVSGIPMLEKKKSGDLEFEEYKKTTSVLIPLPPKPKF